jgi:hypothetical protein
MPQDRMIGCKSDRRKFRKTKLANVVLGTVLAALVVCAHVPIAHAGDDDADENESFTDKFLRTLGIRNLGTTEYEINYSERSPLVVPPTRNLPTPVAATPSPAPNWPKDPDIKKRKEAMKDNDKPVIRNGDSVIEDSRALRPDELNVGRATPTVAAPGTAEQTTPVTPSAKKNIFNFNWLNKEEQATFTGEPPRQALTDPPPGYLTPSPDQPYGIQPTRKVYKPPTLGERMEPQR